MNAEISEAIRARSWVLDSLASYAVCYANVITIVLNRTKLCRPVFMLEYKLNLNKLLSAVPIDWLKKVFYVHCNAQKRS